MTSPTSFVIILLVILVVLVAYIFACERAAGKTAYGGASHPTFPAGTEMGRRRHVGASEDDNDITRFIQST